MVSEPTVIWSMNTDIESWTYGQRETRGDAGWLRLHCSSVSGQQDQPCGLGRLWESRFHRSQGHQAEGRGQHQQVPDHPGQGHLSPGRNGQCPFLAKRLAMSHDFTLMQLSGCPLYSVGNGQCALLFLGVLQWQSGHYNDSYAGMSFNTVNCLLSIELASVLQLLFCKSSDNQSWCACHCVICIIIFTRAQSTQVLIALLWKWWGRNGSCVSYICSSRRGLYFSWQSVSDLDMYTWCNKYYVYYVSWSDCSRGFIANTLLCLIFF